MGRLKEDLTAIAKQYGLDLFGVADLSKAKAFVVAQGGAHLAQFPRAISIGVHLLDAIVDELYRHEEPSVILTYRNLYTTANMSLDRAAFALAKRIQREGYKAYPIPASQPVNPRKLEGAFSHKLAAHLAGLGWIGKNCLLITPKYGPRVRLASVLTDAPLEAGKPLTNQCGDCQKCVDACPPRALTGVPFDPKEPRDVRFKAHLCSHYIEKRARLLGVGSCGLCVYICPYGATNIV